VGLVGIRINLSANIAMMMIIIVRRRDDFIIGTTAAEPDEYHYVVVPPTYILLLLLLYTHRPTYHYLYTFRASRPAVSRTGLFASFGRNGP